MILYGSCARDECRADSDIDLMVITDINVCKEYPKEVITIQNDCRDLNADVHFCSEQTFNTVNTVYYRFIKRGYRYWAVHSLILQRIYIE